MKKFILLALVFSLFILNGCVEDDDTLTRAIDVIHASKVTGNQQEQVKFILEHAYNFIDNKSYDESIKCTQYILFELDKNNFDAKKLLHIALTQKELESQSNVFTKNSDDQ